MIFRYYFCNNVILHLNVHNEVEKLQTITYKYI